MSTSPQPDENTPVTLNFQISFHKTETVLAPDRSPHPLTIKCIKQNFEYETIRLGVFEAHDRPDDIHARQAFIRKTSEGRALLAAALALFDAHFASFLSEPGTQPPPAERGEAAC